MISALGTADFIVNGLKNLNFSAALVPAAIFIFAGFTGSPLAVVLAAGVLLAVMMVWGKVTVHGGA